MSTTELKDYLHEAIDKIDDETFLKTVLALMKDFNAQDKVGSIGSTSLTKADIIKKTIKAESDIAANETYTISEVANHFANKK